MSWQLKSEPLKLNVLCELRVNTLKRIGIPAIVVDADVVVSDTAAPSIFS